MTTFSVNKLEFSDGIENKVKDKESMDRILSILNPIDISDRMIVYKYNTLQDTKFIYLLITPNAYLNQYHIKKDGYLIYIFNIENVYHFVVSSINQQTEHSNILTLVLKDEGVQLNCAFDTLDFLNSYIDPSLKTKCDEHDVFSFHHNDLYEVLALYKQYTRKLQLSQTSYQNDTINDNAIYHGSVAVCGENYSFYTIEMTSDILRKLCMYFSDDDLYINRAGNGKHHIIKYEGVHVTLYFIGTSIFIDMSSCLFKNTKSINTCNKNNIFTIRVGFMHKK